MNIIKSILLVALFANNAIAAPNIQALIDVQSKSQPAFLDLNRLNATDGRCYWNATLSIRDRPYGIVINGGGRIFVSKPGRDRPCIDCTGSSHIVFRDFALMVADPSAMPSCGVLLSRPKSGASAGLHVFDNFSAGDYFAIAAIVNIGSETNAWNSCEFVNIAGSRVAYLACTSPPVKLYPPAPAGTKPADDPLTNIGSGGLLCQSFNDCRWRVNCDASGTATCMVLRSITNHFVMGDIHIRQGVMSAAGGTGTLGKAGILIDAPDVVMRQISIDGVRAETDPCRNFITKTPGSRPANIAITNCTLHSRESIVAFPAPGNPGADSIYGLRMENNTYQCGMDRSWGGNVRALVVVGDAVKSYLDLSNMHWEAQNLGVPNNWPVNYALECNDATSSVVIVDQARAIINNRHLDDAHTGTMLIELKP